MSRLLFLLCFFSLYTPWVSALQIQAQGLFNGAAVLNINGKQHMLREGKKSPEGVLLVSASPKKAIIQINGKRQELTLSRQINNSYSEADAKAEVSIRRNMVDQYITQASFNGKRRPVLVDTGANIIAMSSRDAQSLNIDYEKGQVGFVVTASGRAPSYRVSLRSVEVGGIRISGVDASIIEGDYPEMILLGMSFLKRVDMREENGVLYLKSKL